MPKNAAEKKAARALAALMDLPYTEALRRVREEKAKRTVRCPGWYSGDDGEICPECMTESIRGQA